jgi:glycosyltransferase involved in cell wall biosynthesis
VARLLFITGTPLDVRGGSGTYVGISVLRDAVEARGHHVDLLAPTSTGYVSLVRRVAFNVALRGRPGRFQPDVVVGFDYDGLFLPRSAAPHVASVKGVIAEEARFEAGIPRLRLAAEAVLEKRHVLRADRILATSRHSAIRIAEDYGVSAGRIFVVPELIDLARWQSAISEATSPPHSYRTILCVGHLYPRKDVATLLRALKGLPRDVSLRVAGAGPELPRLKRAAAALSIADRVAFLGHIPFSTLAAEYRCADIFCLPSRQEGFGIVFLEAMAAGLPIVAARAAAVPEVVADGECGLLVSPQNPEELASALARLLSDPAERRRLGSGGIERVRRYDAREVAAKFLKAVGLNDESGESPLIAR